MKKLWSERRKHFLFNRPGASFTGHVYGRTRRLALENLRKILGSPLPVGTRLWEASPQPVEQRHLRRGSPCHYVTPGA